MVDSAIAQGSARPRSGIVRGALSWTFRRIIGVYFRAIETALSSRWLWWQRGYSDLRPRRRSSAIAARIAPALRPAPQPRSRAVALHAPGSLLETSGGGTQAPSRSQA